MSTGLLGTAKRHPLITFFLLAYGISWLGAIPYAFGVFPIPMFPFGPLLAALIAAAATGGWQSTRTLLLWMLQWRGEEGRGPLALLGAVGGAPGPPDRPLAP